MGNAAASVLVVAGPSNQGTILRQSKAAYAFDESEPDRCHARASRSDGRCKKKAVPGRMTCPTHGGVAGRPSEHWTNAFGRIGQMLQKTLDEESLTDLHVPLGIFRMEVDRDLARAEEVDTPAFRLRALEKMRELEEAYTDEDPDRIATTMTELSEYLENGVNEDAAHVHLMETTTKFARRLEEYWKIRLARANVMNKQDVMAVIALFVDLINESIPEEYATRAVSRVTGALLDAGSRFTRAEEALTQRTRAVRGIQRSTGGLPSGSDGLRTMDGGGLEQLR